MTPGTFTLLGRPPLLGRTLQDGDRFAIVISYGYWQRQLGGDPAVIGRQVAVGGQTATISSLSWSDGFALAAAGIAIGVAAVLAAALALASHLYGIRPRDPVTLVAVPGLLLASAIAASAIPARRAMRVDPATTTNARI